MVRHVMKDGTVRQDVKGLVVGLKENPQAYEVLEQVRRKQRKEGDQKKW